MDVHNPCRVGERAYELQANQSTHLNSRFGNRLEHPRDATMVTNVRKILIFITWLVWLTPILSASILVALRQWFNLDFIRCADTLAFLNFEGIVVVSGMALILWIFDTPDGS